MRKSKNIAMSIYEVKKTGINEKINKWKADYIIKQINLLPMSKKEKTDCINKIIRRFKKNSD